MNFSADLSPSSSIPLIRFQGVSFSYGTQLILSELSWDLFQGNFECVIGRSGCGKSTLLQLLCGLIPPTKGAITFKGSSHFKPVKEISFVFQKPNLLEWLSVIDNVVLPLKISGCLNTDGYDRALVILDSLGIASHAKKAIGQISGGEQSRVAIARALVANPRVLLMDEPFASLDAITREELQYQLRGLHEKLGLTTVFVTHDIQEAIFLSDRVHVLDKGQLVHSQNIEHQDSRDPREREDLQFLNYCHVLRTALGSGVGFVNSHSLQLRS